MNENSRNLFLLLYLFHENGLLLVLAAFVLEPDADDARTEAGHLDQLLLHEGVGTRVGGVAGTQRVQLLLVEDGAHARRFPVRTASAACARTAGPAAAVSPLFGAAYRPLPVTLLARRRYARVRTVCSQ